MIKAIFFDIDGTLISFQTHTMAESTKLALQKLRQEGIKLFISTGRAPSNTAFIKELFDFDGYVTMNGQYCFCGDELIYEKSFSREDISAFVNLAKTTPYSYCFVEPAETYIDKVTKPYTDICKLVNLPIPPVKNLSYVQGRKIYQLVVSIPQGKEYQITDKVPNALTTRWHPSFVDVIPRDGGKDKGIDAMIQHFHIKREEIMAFGDGENDISMLRFAGIGVAMKNAETIVQEQADYVTSSVDDNGIYNALLHYSIIDDISHPLK